MSGRACGDGRNHDAYGSGCYEFYLLRQEQRGSGGDVRGGRLDGSGHTLCCARDAGGDHACRDCANDFRCDRDHILRRAGGDRVNREHANDAHE
jgi:hypothetical protein